MMMSLLYDDEFLEELETARRNGHSPDGALRQARLMDADTEEFTQMIQEEIAELVPDPTPTASGWLPSFSWLKR